MPRPPLEVADIVRAAGKKYIENSRAWITRQHLKVLRAIECCRTAALGWHVDECTRCGYSGHSYNSCRDRHCPKCQGNARLRWINGRKKELLPVPYAHIVFTVPRLLAQLALQNKQLIYAMLLRLSAETLIEVARNPKRVAEHDGREVRLPFDALLCAVGRVANTAGYGLEELGIPVTKARTVEVNEHMQTLYPNIFACGDVAGPYQFTHTAAHTAWYAAVNALFGSFRRFRATSP